MLSGGPPQRETERETGQTGHGSSSGGGARPLAATGRRGAWSGGSSPTTTTSPARRRRPVDADVDDVTLVLIASLRQRHAPPPPLHTAGAGRASVACQCRSLHRTYDNRGECLHCTAHAPISSPVCHSSIYISLARVVFSLSCCSVQRGVFCRGVAIFFKPFFLSRFTCMREQ